MFLDYVIRLHGIPDYVVSDHVFVFGSQLWNALSKSFNVSNQLSASFYPQSNDQNKHMNHTVEQYLRIYCNYHQDDWSRLLYVPSFLTTRQALVIPVSLSICVSYPSTQSLRPKRWQKVSRQSMKSSRINQIYSESADPILRCKAETFPIQNR
jgi:hypothetical protein